MVFTSQKQERSSWTLFTVANSTTRKYSFVAFIWTFYWLTRFFFPVNFSYRQSSGRTRLRNVGQVPWISGKSRNLSSLSFHSKIHGITNFPHRFHNYPTFICLVFTFVNWVIYLSSQVSQCSPLTTCENGDSMLIQRNGHSVELE